MFSMSTSTRTSTASGRTFPMLPIRLGSPDLLVGHALDRPFPFPLIVCSYSLSLTLNLLLLITPPPPCLRITRCMWIFLILLLNHEWDFISSFPSLHSGRQCNQWLLESTSVPVHWKRSNRGHCQCILCSNSDSFPCYVWVY